ncbi:MAG: MBL fold metallo-hydrolase, partial [Myxococcota bacterium]
MRLLALALTACAGNAPPAWSPGELYIEQIGLGAGTIGEAALLVGPEGTAVLLDVGNDAHADAVAEAVERATGSRRVDWIVLTHFHADHVGGMDDLGVEVTRGVVTRGDLDRTDDANADEWDEVTALRAVLPFVDLCEGEGVATGCPGLAGPGVSEGPGVLALGEGAELRVLVADGFTVTDTGVAAFGELGADENARSLGGIVRWGDFVYWWGGDLTGGGKGTPDVEGWLAGVLPADALPPEGVDVAHLHHHGISSSTSAAWAARLFPGDTHGAAIVGATGAYLDAPSDEALATVGPRLGDGLVWATENGWTATTDDRLHVAHGSVVVRVAADGAWRVEGGGR